MKAIDLHVHSTFSDGTLTPAELITKANDIGLSAMALTDHDTLDGIDEAISAAKNVSLEFIPGIELSCSYGGFKEIHIVGLYVEKTKEMCQRLLELQKTRSQRNEKIVERFLSLGIQFTLDELKEKYKDAVITRAHFADYLLEKKYVGSRKEAFDRYLNDKGPCFVPREYINPSEAIRLIHEANGVSILAHPTLYHLSDDVLKKMLSDLKADGLDGIECIYSTYTMGEELQMRHLAKEFDLLQSGGSDYHGGNKPNIQLGVGKGHLFVPYDILKPIKTLKVSSQLHQQQSL